MVTVIPGGLCLPGAAPPGPGAGEVDGLGVPSRRRVLDAERHLVLRRGPLGDLQPGTESVLGRRVRREVHH